MLKSILLGVVQGLTEFLPVSSSGHLVLAEHFLKIEKSGVLLEVVLHLGTICAVVIYMRREIWSLIQTFFKWTAEILGMNKSPTVSEQYKTDKRLLLGVIIATIPTGLMGFFFKDFFERLFSRVDLVGVAFIITAAILFAGETLSMRRKSTSHDVGPIKSIIIGIAQGIAITPGISRSGSTISAGLMLGLEPEAAVRFSFLLSIPAVLGATVLKLKGISAIEHGELLGYGIGALTAAVVGYLSIGLLITAVRKVKLRWFALYCLLLGTVVIIATF